MKRSQLRALIRECFAVVVEAGLLEVDNVRPPSDDEYNRAKSHVSKNHPNHKLSSIGVDKKSGKVNYGALPDKNGPEVHGQIEKEAFGDEDEFMKGQIWRVPESGKWGAKNKAGQVRYFSPESKDAARKFSQGTETGSIQFYQPKKASPSSYSNSMNSPLRKTA